VQQPQRRRLHGNEILVVGRRLEELRALGERARTLPQPEVGRAEKLGRRMVVGQRLEGALGERAGRRGVEVHRRESRTNEHAGMGVGSRGALGEACKGAARVAGSLQQGRLGAAQGIVVREFLERPIEGACGLGDVAGTHPDELRQAVMRLGAARIEPHAFAQSELGVVEALEAEECAGARVMQRRGRPRARQRLGRDALGFLGLPRGIQGVREGMGDDGVVRSLGQEATIVRDRLPLAAERGIGCNVQRREVRVRESPVAPGRGHPERESRLTGVEVMARE
jgi:hypothetical protein